MSTYPSHDPKQLSKKFIRKRKPKPKSIHQNSYKKKPRKYKKKNIQNRRHRSKTSKYHETARRQAKEDSQIDNGYSQWTECEDVEPECSDSDYPGLCPCCAHDYDKEYDTSYHTIHFPVSIQLIYRSFEGKEIVLKSRGTLEPFLGRKYPRFWDFTWNRELENIRCFSPYGAFVNWMFPWDNPEMRGGIEDFMKEKDFKYLKGM